MIKQINFRAFIKPFLFLSLSLFVGCSTVANNSILKPQEKIELKVSNNISVYYYTMAETALQNGDLELSLSLYMKADKAAPDNVYIKEIILEILALGAQYNPDKYTEIIEIGESYLERDIVSKRILEVLANAYISTKDNEKAKEIFKLLVNKFPTMQNCLSYYSLLSAVYGKKDYKILDKALNLKWEDIDQVISIILVYDDDDKSIDLIHKAYLTWTDKKPRKSHLKSDYKKFGFDKVISDFIYEAIRNNQQINEVKVEQLIKYLVEQKEYDKLFTIAPKFINSSSKYIKTTIFASFIENEDWENVAKLGSLLLPIEDPYIFRFIQYNTALAFTKLSNYQQALQVISLSKEFSGTIILFGLIYKEVDLEGKKNLLSNLEEYWSDKSTISALKITANIVDANYSFASIENIPPELLEDKDIMFYWANSLLDYEDINGAELLFDKIKYEDFDVTNYIAGYYSSKGKYDLVLEYLKDKLFRQEDLDARSYYLAAFAASQQGEFDLFWQLSNSALENFPEDPMLLNAFGYTIADMNLTEYFPQAEKYIKKALEKEPEEAMYWDSLAWLYFRQGNYSEAEKIMLEHCEDILDDSAISYHLAEILLKLNKTDQAKEMLIRSIQTNSDKESIEKSKELLEKYFDDNKTKDKE
jgi:predicted Zn-dependent protease